ncbi:AI-2E family transporter [Rhodobacteraceae bacterium 2CG4]|uniref:AI-2E family transporter n=1 Tax=Halovulum marinum TaxID=2662447 RepID=A0A6L5YXI6_9RHOB|nr:AI-2E family transporter [Halovulum marinum]
MPPPQDRSVRNPVQTIKDSEPAPEPGLWTEAPRWALIGIFLILAFGAIAMARDFLMPLSLGILLFFVFSPICRGMVRMGVPRPIAAALITAALFAGLVAAAASLTVPVSNVMENAPRLLFELESKLDRLQGSMKGIQEAAEKIDELSNGGSDDETTIKAETQSEDSFLNSLARTTPQLFAQLAFTFVLLYFMLASGHLLYKRIVQSFSAISDKRQALEAMYEIEESLGSYLGAITLINACLGVAVGLAMWLWGMPAPLLFGVFAFAVNFVPYVGAVAGVALSTVVALVTMPGVFQPVLVGLTYFVLTSTEGQFVTPYFVSRRLRLNTVVVFVTVALWAWLWSVMGMIVAVPMLVVLRVLCSYVPGLRSFGNFLAGDDEPEPVKGAAGS